MKFRTHSCRLHRFYLYLRKHVNSAQKLASIPLRNIFGNLCRAWLPACAFLTFSSLAAASTARLYDLWPIEEGSLPGTVTSVVQTRDGYIWLGTYQGLLRFDGVRFTVFDSTHTKGLETSRITALYEDNDGALWIGHETGQLTQFQNGQFHPADTRSKWPGGAVEAIATDGSNEVWLLNNTGVLIRLGDGHRVETPGGASPSRKVALSRGKGGRLWIASNGMAGELERGRFAGFKFPDSSSSDYYERVAGARDGGFWVLVNGHIRKRLRNRWEMDFGEFPWRRLAPVTAVLESSSGALMIGTLNDGLYVLRGGAETLHYSRTNGLSHDWVRTLCEDHEGNLWIGTGSGLDTLRPRKIKMLQPADHFQGRGVLSFAVRPDGSAWVGTEGAGLYHYNGADMWTNYAEPSGLANLFVWSVLATRADQLFVGTWGGGLAIKTGDRFVSPGVLAQITDPVVALLEDQAANIWIGTTSGLYRYSQGNLSLFAGKESLAFPDVRHITQSPDGTLWFGLSGGGLCQYRETTLKQFRKRDGLISDFISSLYADTDGTLWIGTTENGLGRWKEGKFSNVGMEQELATRVISQIVDDGLGNLWLGSNKGILRVSKTELHRCADGLTKTAQLFRYGKGEGLASLNCLGGFHPAACRTPQGMLWFPTAKGIATIDPARVVYNPVPPPVVIEQAFVDDQPVDLALCRPTAGKLGPDPTLLISPGRHRFELHYTALSFAAPDKVRFRHKLDPLEQDWVEAGPNRVAEYSYLSPGAYRFSVVACNNDEVWSLTGASLAFRVLPHFWQTWWFRVAVVAACVAAVGGGVATVMRRRVRRKLEQLERQRALERERARIARDIHDELGASLTRITLLSQSARSELSDQHLAAGDVDQIYTNARELTRAMDEIVWAVNPKHDTFDSLVTYLGRSAQQFLSAANIRCRLDVPLQLPAWTLTAEIRHNLFLAFKETLHNIVKHAHATEVRVSLELLPQGFVLLVADNGRGFAWAGFKNRLTVPSDGIRLATGNGLLNMQKRLEEIGGRCDWNTAPGQGTRVKFSIWTGKHNGQSEICGPNFSPPVIKTDDN